MNRELKILLVKFSVSMTQALIVIKYKFLLLINKDLSSQNHHS